VTSLRAFPTVGNTVGKYALHQKTIDEMIEHFSEKWEHIVREEKISLKKRPKLCKAFCQGADAMLEFIRSKVEG
jgi:hypothetical protein